MALINLENVTKTFRIVKREKGFGKFMKSLFAPEHNIIRAVDGISFEIAKGELVGFIGPNGAGKSTTIKMLCGILVPTSGEITVNGRIPYKERQKNAFEIGVVFGQRSQLFWDLPVVEVFDLFRKMYRVEQKRFDENVAFYMELLDMGEFLHTPVRQLSLGQKMRANIAVSFLHDPQIIYLDEPTIGLDVLAKDRIRRFIRDVNRERSVTVLLTTHDMNDIESICDRLIMIDKGKIIYDGMISAFKNAYCHDNLLVVDFEEEYPEISDARLSVIREEGPRKEILYDKRIISSAEAVSIITGSNKVIDISIKEPEIEDVVKQIYQNDLLPENWSRR